MTRNLSHINAQKWHIYVKQKPFIVPFLVSQFYVKMLVLLMPPFSINIWSFIWYNYASSVWDQILFMVFLGVSDNCTIECLVSFLSVLFYSQEVSIFQNRILNAKHVTKLFLLSVLTDWCWNIYPYFIIFDWYIEIKTSIVVRLSRYPKAVWT